MSIEAIAFSCFVFVAVVILGYLYTAVEFKHMSDLPEEFSRRDRRKKIRIPDKEGEGG